MARPRSVSANPAVDLDALPGHHIRLLQQIAVAVFLQETEAWNVTPVQYAALQAVANGPAMDQRTLARTIGLDASTIGGVLERLEARGLLVRTDDPADRRVRLLAATDAGRALLRELGPAMLRAQDRMLAPLSPRQRVSFMRLLRTLTHANNTLSRAPRAT